MSDEYTITGTLICQVIDDLKYLNRLNKHEFIDLFFPGEWWAARPETGYDTIRNGQEVIISPYGHDKWSRFRTSIFDFLNGCDRSRFEKIAEYIESIKGGE